MRICKSLILTWYMANMTVRQSCHRAQEVPLGFGACGLGSEAMPVVRLTLSAFVTSHLSQTTVRGGNIPAIGVDGGRPGLVAFAVGPFVGVDIAALTDAAIRVMLARLLKRNRMAAHVASILSPRAGQDRARPVDPSAYVLSAIGTRYAHANLGHRTDKSGRTWGHIMGRSHVLLAPRAPPGCPWFQRGDLASTNALPFQPGFDRVRDLDFSWLSPIPILAIARASWRAAAARRALSSGRQ